MFVQFQLFFFNDTATTEIYTLSLHDALPISAHLRHRAHDEVIVREAEGRTDRPAAAACREVRRVVRSEEHTSELQSQSNLVCRLLLEKKKKIDVVNHGCDVMRRVCGRE